MRVISTVICIFTAFILMATPVLACCFTGHAKASSINISAPAAEMPACHDSVATHSMTKTGTDLSQQEVPEKFCTSCDDCTMSPVEMEDITPAVSTNTNIDIFVLAVTTRLPFGADVDLPASTGPPLDPQSLPVDKPLYKTDILHI